MADAKKPREWAPHIWEGCDLFSWWSLLRRGRWRVSPRLWPVAAIITHTAFWHTGLRWLQEHRFGEVIRRTKIVHAPIFILGHWRSGTTLLHELLVLDPAHSYPTTYQCFVPHHFLLTEEFFRRHMNFLLPEKRPMDRMPTGWGRPQEDEFALAMLGLPSPYADIAFPNDAPIDKGALDLETLSPKDRRRWERGFYRFLQALTFKDARRLVLKSPPHSCRIPTLLRLFPDARFIHIVRNPYAIYPSTLNLWRAFYRVHGLQVPTHERLPAYVLATGKHLYEKLEAGKRLIPAGRFVEVRYEELVRDTIGTVQRVYAELDLGPFERLARPLQGYLEANRNFEPNRFRITPEERAAVASAWSSICERYGYAPPSEG